MTPSRSPIRRGAASRLGLRTPYSRPGGILTWRKPISGEQMRELAERFEALNVNARMRTMIVPRSMTMERKGWPWK